MGGGRELRSRAGACGEQSGMCLSSCAPCFTAPQDLASHQGSRAQHLPSQPLGRTAGIAARAWLPSEGSREGLWLREMEGLNDGEL